MTRACDASCYELVKAFLAEEGITRHQTIFEIACDVQQAIEGGIATAKLEHAEAGGEDVVTEKIMARFIVRNFASNQEAEQWLNSLPANYVIRGMSDTNAYITFAVEELKGQGQQQVQEMAAEK